MMERIPLQRIASRENRAFRRLLAVRDDRPEDGDEGLALLEGHRLCEEALRSGLRPEALALSEDAAGDPRVAAFLALLPDVAPRYVLPDALFRRLCRTERPQGVLLAVESPALRELPDAADPQGRYLVLEDVQDPGNVGSMVRTADAAGLAGVACTPGCADPFGDKALRASMGSAFHLPILRAELDALVAWLRAAGLPIVAADLGGADLHDATLPGRGALLVGNEGAGLSPQALALSDLRVRIPMPGRAESLNAAAAAAVLVYDMLKASRGGPEGAGAPDPFRKDR